MKYKLLISGLMLSANLALFAQQQAVELFLLNSRLLLPFIQNRENKLFLKKFMASLPNIWEHVFMVAYGLVRTRLFLIQTDIGMMCLKP